MPFSCQEPTRAPGRRGIDNAPFSINGSAFESTIKFEVSSSTTFDFRAGVDFGGGGTLVLGGTALATNGKNMWWNYSYSDPSQFLAGGATRLRASTP